MSGFVSTWQVSQSTPLSSPACRPDPSVGVERPAYQPDALWQRCVVHFYRNVLTKAPRSKARIVSDMLKAIHAQEDLESAREKAKAVAVKLDNMRLSKAAKTVREGAEETLSYMNFPREYWLRIRTNNPLERIMREIRRRTRVVGNFPDGKSALMLVAARLRHIQSTRWGNRVYLNMKLLKEEKEEVMSA